MNDVWVKCEPQADVASAAIALATLVVVWTIARQLFGAPNAVSQRLSLMGIRGLTLSLFVALLINPIKWREIIAAKQSADVFYLLDASQSMAVGDKGSRWKKSLEIIRDSQQNGGDQLARVSLFRFGQRLQAVDPALWKYPTDDFKPTDSDTQLAAALRQLTSRFGRTPPAAVVVFSDGRARDASDIEKLASHFAAMKVPVHVVPVGEADKGGDLAIVGVVSPQEVRKNSQVEVRVFLRSYGFDDKRSELVVSSIDREGVRHRLNSIPLTIRSGVQTVTTNYQSSELSQKIEVAITPIAGELSLENNRYDFDVTIDRTKIRVLYIEGGAPSLVRLNTTVKVGSESLPGPHSDLQDALSADSEIDCVVLSAPPGSRRMQRVTEGPVSAFNRGFPTTAAELAAFDAIIFSNTARSTFTEEQLGWIEQWIEKRGGGFCMTGGPNSFAAGGWRDTVVERILPIEMGSVDTEWHPSAGIKLNPVVATVPHPIWRILENDVVNRELLRTLPEFAGIHTGQRVKTDTNSVVLASSDDQGTTGAGLTIGSFGKGRTAALSVPSTPPWASEFTTRWGEGNNRYYAKFWRNMVYWLTEDSSIGRRRLIAKADEPFYRPAEKVTLKAVAFDESANQTAAYRLVAMIEPQGNAGDADPNWSPFRWPDGLQRISGETGPYIAWGEELEIPRVKGQSDYGLQLVLGPASSAAGATQSIRLELTAYEDTTQVDSTAIDLRIVHDPYEQQNPFPQHEHLLKLAAASGGSVLSDAKSIREMFEKLPVPPQSSVIRKSPWWDQWWILGTFLCLMTVEWLWRRHLGLG